MRNFRKNLNILVCSILIGFSLLLSGCFVATPKATSIEIVEESIPKEVTIDDFNLSDIKIIVNKMDGTSEIINVTKDMLSSDALEKLSKSGTHYIYIRYNGKIAIATITLLDKYPNVLVVFDSCGGSSIKRQVIEKNSLALRPNDPTKKGYSFAGWYKDRDLANPFSFSERVSETITLYAAWEPVENVVRFETNGGSEIDNAIIATGEMFIYPTPPTKPGYSFSGWFTDEGLTKEYVANYVNDSFVLYAKWTANKYTVSFETNGGSEIGDIVVSYDSLIIEPIDAKRYGYVLEGWYIDSEFKTVFNFNNPIKENITLYAKWLEASYIIKFMTNGGNDINDLAIGQDEYLPEDIIPERQNYRFTGWYLDINLTTPYDINSPITSSLTLYAKWEGINLVVQFDTDGAGEINDVNVRYGDLLVKPQYPRKEGYIFAGWYKDQERTQQYNFNSPVIEDITLYAKWVVDTSVKPKHTVTLYDGYMNVFATLEVNEGDLLNISPIEMEGLAFEGWYLAPSYEVKYDLTIPVTIDLELYAYFVEVYTITFVDINGRILEIQEVLSGYNATSISAPEISEYDFIGWDHSLVNIQTSFVARPVYELHKYIAKFMVGDIVIKTEHIESGSCATSPINVSNYTPVGHHFARWDKTLNPMYSDVTYNAIFEKNEYTITYRDYSGVIYEVDKYLYNDKIVRPEFNENDYIEVINWYKDNTFTERFSFSGNVTSNMVVYGKFDFKNRISYETNEDEITITNFNLRNVSDLNIPSYLNDKKIVAITGFTNYDNLVKITINPNLRTINVSDLSNALLLKEINVNANDVFTSIDGVLYRGSTLLLYPRNKEGNSFTATASIIGDYAFKGNVNLTRLDLSNVTSIGEYAFSGSNITHLTLGNSCVKGTNTFNDVNDSIIILVPSSSYSSYLSNWSDVSDNLYSTSQINGGFLYYETSSEISIIEYLGDSKNVVIPNTINTKNVTTICSYAFNGIEIIGLDLGNITNLEDNALNKLNLKYLKINSNINISDSYLTNLKSMLTNTNVYVNDSLIDNYNFTKQHRLSSIDGDFAYQTINDKYGIIEYFGSDSDIIIPSSHNDNDVKFLIKDFNDNNITSITLNSEIELDGESIDNNVMVFVSDELLDKYREKYPTVNIYPNSIDIRSNGDYIYGIYNDKVTIIKIISTMSELTIPDTLDGYVVNRIGKYALRDNDTLRLIRINRQIEFIDLYALRSKDSSNVLEIVFSKLIAPQVGGEICHLTDKIYRESEMLREYGARFKNHVVSVYTQEVFELGDYLYSKNNHFATILKYIGNDLEVYIPQEIDGLTIDRIASYAFSGKNISKIYVPNSVEYLEYLAFGGVNNLEEVIINSNKVIDLESQATNSSAVIRVNSKYSHRYRLDDEWKNEEIINDNTEIKNSYDVYYYQDENGAVIVRMVEDYYKVTLPGEVDGIKVYRIAPFALYDTNITNLTINNYIEEIGYYALPKDLETLIFRNVTKPIINEQESAFKINVSDIYYSDFIDLDYEVKAYNQVDDIEGDFEYRIIGNEVTITKYLGNSSDVIIPQTIQIYPVRAIGDYAFKDNTSLVSVTFSSNLREIGEEAFSGCTNLVTINLAGGINNIKANAFSGTSFINSNTHKLVIIDKVLYKYISAFDSTGNVVIDSNISLIAPYAFASATKLTSITIPTGVSKIGAYAFSGCTNLIEIDLPNTVKTIDDYAFSNCIRLRDVWFGTRLETINEGAFSGCTNLSTMNIGNLDYLKNISDYAFSGCNNLLSVTLPSSIETLGNDIFFSDNNLEEVILANDYYYINNGVLYNGNKTTVICDLLKERAREVSLDNNVVYIKENAFNGSNVTKVIINSNVKIYKNAFVNNLGLSSIVFLGDRISEFGISSISNNINLYLLNSLLDEVRGDEVFDKYTVKGIISYTYNSYTIKVGASFNPRPNVIIDYNIGDISYQISDQTVLDYVNGEFIGLKVGSVILTALLNTDEASSVEIVINVVK